MSEKTALITGATSGFGQLIAQDLVRKAYKLIIFARSQVKADRLLRMLNSTDEVPQVEVVLCDLSSFQSVIDACQYLEDRCGSLDLIIHNAGVMNFELKESADGIEETLQVNLLAPMLITWRLLKLLQNGSEPKLIFTASGLHQGTIRFDDLEFRQAFSGFKAYRQSKLGIILMTRLLAQQEELKGITTISIHPGIVRTELGRNAGWFSRMVFFLMGGALKKGASTHLYAIGQPPEALVDGAYYANSKVTKTTAQGYDMEMAAQLYKVVLEYLAPYLEDKANNINSLGLV